MICSPRRLRPTVRAAVLAAALAVASGPARGQDTYTNRLAASPDPYLRLHAHNPVDWYPWGPEAFAKARAEGKPIFLSIGYSTCYWCHVAERTIYSDPAIAALMNKWFVNVKVDREQRPDVDRLYLVATEMLTQQGAWPNNLFLTPDGLPFYAGSYFPPKDEPGGTPGFPRVLAAIHDLWANHRADKAEPAAHDLAEALRRVAAAQSDAKPVPVTPDAWLRQAAAALIKSVDPVNGGFGRPQSGPKFPQAPALDLLLAATRAGDVAAQRALTSTLEAMAYGGIHDQLGGGFHRYSTDPTWTIPHFEKMLSDNAQLLSLYDRAYGPTRTPLLRDVAQDVADYLLRDMQAPDGGFYTAQDAEIDGLEGADYLWTRAQIEQELGAADTDRLLAVYEIAPLPDDAPDPNGEAKRTAPGGVLRVRMPIDDTVRRVGATDPVSMLNAVASLRADLLTVRRDRPQPATDEKIVIGLNGLAIGALAQAARDLDRPDYRAAVEKAADRIWSLAFDPGTGALKHEIIGRAADVDGDLADYAMFGGGVLDLATAADGAAGSLWAARAARLADAMLARFQRPDGRLAGAADAELPIALGDDGDTEVPSGLSAALDLLARLHARHPDETRYAAAGARLATAMSGRIAAHPTMWPSAIAALAAHPLPAAALAAAAPQRTDAPPSAPARIAGVPGTADHVHAAARVDGDAIVVAVTIDPGYHINAHVPSLDYLVPTDLGFGGLAPASVAYPAPARFKPSFSTDALAVYEGDVSVAARFAPGALSDAAGVSGALTAQACDAKTCLPPATIPFAVVGRR